MVSASTSATTSNTNSTNTTISGYNATCMQNAVTKREASINSALQSYFSEKVAILQSYSNVTLIAFNKRTQALVQAYGLTDAKNRSKAVNAARKEYNTEYANATKVYNDANKLADKNLTLTRAQAWKTFDADRTSCKVKERLENPEK